MVSLQLWVALPQPCLELGAIAASVYFLSHFPSPVSLWLFCLARSMEAGASMWQSCTETCQCCYKLSCTASAPALFAGPAQGHSCGAQLCCLLQAPPTAEQTLCELELPWFISGVAGIMLMDSRLQKSLLLVKKAGAAVKMGLNTT